MLPKLWRRGDNTAKIQDACRRIAREPLALGGTPGGPADAGSGSLAKYEKTWAARLDLIVRVIQQGETSLPRALAGVVRTLERDRNLTPDHFVAFSEMVSLPQAGGGYLHRGAIVQMVTHLCSSRTQSIVELGSGWGEHLCNIWLSGGPSRARYYACEPSENGRKCALVLGALDSTFQRQLAARYFDYTSPRFDLAPEQDEVVVYSVQSVEQVHQVAPDFVQRVCSLGQSVKVAHLEPIGWQMIERSGWDSITARHAGRCRKRGYNENLWPLLKQAEADGLIVIDQAVPNFFGAEYNPASLVVWHKREAAADETRQTV